MVCSPPLQLTLDAGSHFGHNRGSTLRGRCYRARSRAEVVGLDTHGNLELIGKARGPVVNLVEVVVAEDAGLVGRPRIFVAGR